MIDVGVASPLTPNPALFERNVRPGTDDLADGPAMSTADASAALDAGADVVTTLIDDGADLLVTGDMGIGNTTASAALIALVHRRSACSRDRSGGRASTTRCLSPRLG